MTGGNFQLVFEALDMTPFAFDCFLAFFNTRCPRLTWAFPAQNLKSAISLRNLALSGNNLEANIRVPVCSLSWPWPFRGWSFVLFKEIMNSYQYFQSKFNIIGFPLLFLFLYLYIYSLKIKIMLPKNISKFTSLLYPITVLK